MADGSSGCCCLSGVKAVPSDLGAELSNCQAPIGPATFSADLHSPAHAKLAWPHKTRRHGSSEFAASLSPLSHGCRSYRNYTSHFITFYPRCLQTYTAKSPIRSRSCFSILMSQGWFTNTVFWTYCEIYDTNDKVCPIRTRHQGRRALSPTRPWRLNLVLALQTIY